MKHEELAALRENFEREKKIYDSAVLTFLGIDGFDVYNCSIPFEWKGERYIYGRVERHHEWARSWVRLFKEVRPDVFELVQGAMIYQLEDPYVAFIQGEMILGGTHVAKHPGRPEGLYYYDAYFYRGTDLEDMKYFTTGPQWMKDIRLVQLPDGIGIFTRPEGKIGFTKVKRIEDITPETIAAAPLIDSIDEDGYGGCNQCYYLSSGKIGVIGHQVYPKTLADGRIERVYMNTAFIVDPETGKTEGSKIIATRRCFPASDHIRTGHNGVPLDDTAFSSGFVLRKDGKVDLYSGLSDALEGRCTIDYPFEGYGEVVYGAHL